jgi:glucuronate isomerase
MDENRFLGNDRLAREIYELMREFPILSPHGHVDPKILLENKPFQNPVELLITPDHYVTRMLFSQGVSYEAISIPHVDGSRSDVDPREVWRIFAEHWHAFRSTPSRIWIEEIFYTLFKIDEPLTAERSDYFYDQINGQLHTPEFLPQNLFKKFNIEVMATTDATSDSLNTHLELAKLNIGGRVIPTFRPDDVSDPDRPGWKAAIAELANASGEDCATFASYRNALRNRRDHFKRHGATATDHGVATCQTLLLDNKEQENLFAIIVSGKFSKEDADKFRAMMLLEHARMAADDGLVMQIHPGSSRSHNQQIAKTYGVDRGFDIPIATNYVRELQPLLNEVGLHPNYRAVLFTLDESTYSRELAPLAGVYPSLRLGPPWWFHDSLNGMQRWRDSVTETSGFYNTVGFIDDTRAFASIPVRHDVARRFDAAYLANEVSRHRLSKADALEVGKDIAYNLSKEYFKL